MKEIKMKKFACLITILLLAGCAVKQAQTYDFYGNQAYSLTCNTANKQACVDQANKTCPHGYYLVDEDDTGLLFKSILIRCRA
jgi:hypothetical protein